jgi:chromosomal replication initiation ATPase DnaA
MRLFIKIFVSLCLIVVWNGSAVGIDKSKKDKKTKTKQTVQVDKKKTEQTKPQPDKKAVDSKKTKKSYDNFVDGNNNGIDDRAEKSPSKQKTPPDPPKKDAKP